MDECKVKHCGNCKHWRWIEDTYDDGTYIESTYCMNDMEVYRDTDYNSPPCDFYECDGSI